jgi:hypothetical protein
MKKYLISLIDEQEICSIRPGDLVVIVISTNPYVILYHSEFKLKDIICTNFNLIWLHLLSFS